eukprot:PhF_6_TR26134/c0_g1_i1/m.37004
MYYARGTKSFLFSPAVYGTVLFLTLCFFVMNGTDQDPGVPTNTIPPAKLKSLAFPSTPSPLRHELVEPIPEGFLMSTAVTSTTLIQPKPIPPLSPPLRYSRGTFGWPILTFPSDVALLNCLLVVPPLTGGISLQRGTLLHSVVLAKLWGMKGLTAPQSSILHPSDIDPKANEGYRFPAPFNHIQLTKSKVIVFENAFPEAVGTVGDVWDEDVLNNTITQLGMVYNTPPTSTELNLNTSWLLDVALLPWPEEITKDAVPSLERWRCGQSSRCRTTIGLRQRTKYPGSDVESVFVSNLHAGLAATPRMCLNIPECRSLIADGFFKPSSKLAPMIDTIFSNITNLLAPKDNVTVIAL